MHGWQGSAGAGARRFKRYGGVAAHQWHFDAGVRRAGRLGQLGLPGWANLVLKY
jgi:hypothetical protein